MYVKALVDIDSRNDGDVCSYVACAHELVFYVFQSECLPDELPQSVDIEVHTDTCYQIICNYAHSYLVDIKIDTKLHRQCKFLL